MSSPLLEVDEWREAYVRHCPTCDEDTLPLPNGKCGWCDTVIVKLAPSPQERCTRGHKFTAENTYIRPDGKRYCRACTNANRRKARKLERTLARRRGKVATIEPPPFNECPAGTEPCPLCAQPKTLAAVACRQCRSKVAA